MAIRVNQLTKKYA